MGKHGKPSGKRWYNTNGRLDYLRYLLKKLSGRYIYISCVGFLGVYATYHKLPEPESIIPPEWASGTPPSNSGKSSEGLLRCPYLWCFQKKHTLKNKQIKMSSPIYPFFGMIVLPFLFWWGWFGLFSHEFHQPKSPWWPADRPSMLPRGNFSQHILR